MYNQKGLKGRASIVRTSEKFELESLRGLIRTYSKQLMNGTFKIRASFWGPMINDSPIHVPIGMDNHLSEVWRVSLTHGWRAVGFLLFLLHKKKQTHLWVICTNTTHFFNQCFESVILSIMNHEFPYEPPVTLLIYSLIQNHSKMLEVKQGQISKTFGIPVKKVGPGRFRISLFPSLSKYIHLNII